MIKKHLLRFFISSIFCLMGTMVWAENTSSDTISVKKPAKNNFIITDSIADSNRRKETYQGTFLSLDIFNPVATAWRDGRFETSITLDVDLWHRLFPSVEFGFMTADIKNEDYKYDVPPVHPQDLAYLMEFGLFYFRISENPHLYI